MFLLLNWPCIAHSNWNRMCSNDSQPAMLSIANKKRTKPDFDRWLSKTICYQEENRKEKTNWDYLRKFCMIPSISQIQGIFSGWFIAFLFQLSRWLSPFVSRVIVSITAVGCTEYYNLNWTYEEWMKVLPSLKMVVELLRKTEM